jgi:serine/threonine protein kinase
MTTLELLEVLRSAKVVDSPRLLHYLESIGEHGFLALPVEQACERLVREGLLTPFQVQRLLAGKSRGFVLGGKYRILDLLGVGGMGQVLLCEHIRLQRLVAVKVLPPDRLNEPAALERFHREARAAARLSHPNVVRAYDIDADDSFHFLVMDYVPGINLQRLVEKLGPLDEPRAVDLIRQAAVALAHVHASGLVHRDIKPGNLLVDAAGVVTLLDMGLVRFIDDPRDNLTDRFDEGAILGTLDYISPEQTRSRAALDPRSDLYSLGATMWFLLVGRAPLVGGSVAEKLIALQTRTFSIDKERADLSENLRDILHTLLLKDPDHRFQSAKELVAALSSCKSEPMAPLDPTNFPMPCPAIARLLPTVVPREHTDTGPITAPFSRRRPIRIAVSLVVLLATIGVALWLFWELGHLQTRPFAKPDENDRIDPFVAIDEDVKKPIGPQLAIGRIGFERTVRLIVRNRATDEANIYLHSSEDLSNPDNFTVVIPRQSLDRYREAGVADPYSEYFQCTLEVQGTISYLREKGTKRGAKIEAGDPRQIRRLRSGINNPTN